MAAYLRNINNFSPLFVEPGKDVRCFFQFVSHTVPFLFSVLVFVLFLRIDLKVPVVAAHNIIIAYLINRIK